MVGVQWVRLDANAAQHDKFLALKADASRHKWQAISSYFFALGWSGGQGTDGFIPTYALQAVDGTTVTAQLLVKCRLWEVVPKGWRIVNFEVRQQMNGVTREIQEAQVAGGKRGACSRWHGDDCWKVGHGCTHVAT
jgi:hypothetical protein